MAKSEEPGDPGQGKLPEGLADPLKMPATSPSSTPGRAGSPWARRLTIAGLFLLVLLLLAIGLAWVWVRHLLAQACPGYPARSRFRVRSGRSRSTATRWESPRSGRSTTMTSRSGWGSSTPRTGSFRWTRSAARQPESWQKSSGRARRSCPEARPLGAHLPVPAGCPESPGQSR